MRHQAHAHGRRDPALRPVEPQGPQAIRFPGATIQGTTDDDPIQVVINLQERLSGAIGSVSQTSDELGKVVRQVGDLLSTNEQRINRIVAQTDETTSLLRDTVHNANEIFGDPGTRRGSRTPWKTSPS